jgi:hypothetical protein
MSSKPTSKRTLELVGAVKVHMPTWSFVQRQQIARYRLFGAVSGIAKIAPLDISLVLPTPRSADLPGLSCSYVTHVQLQ